MSLFQKIGILIKAIVLLVGTALSAWGLFDTLHLSLTGAEPLAFSFRRGIPSAALLALSMAYARLLYRRSFPIKSLVAYAGSYIWLGLVLDITVSGMGKNFAPASPQEALISWAISLAIVFASLVLAVWLILKQAPNNSL